MRNSISRHLFGHVTLHYRSFCQSLHTAVAAATVVAADLANLAGDIALCPTL